MKSGYLQGACLWALLMCWNFSLVCEGQIQFPGSGGVAHNNPFSPRPTQPPSQLQSEDSGCNCFTKTSCRSGLGQLQTGCLTESGDRGICCVQQKGAILTRVGFFSSDVTPTSISSNVIDTGFQMGRSFFTTLKNTERQRIRSGEYLQRGDPARGHTYFFQRSRSAQQIHELAYTIAHASVEIANMQSFSPPQSFFNLPTARIGPSQMGFQCPLNNNPNCNANSKYRTIDGTCNNLRNPLLGKSETGFKRLSQALYSDGIMEPREQSVEGVPLPSARRVSSIVLLDIDVPDLQFTLSVMQWAQFMDHDITHAPFDDMDGEGIRCCNKGNLVSPMPTQCFPILVPQGDGFYRPKGQGCINFVRSMLSLNANCQLGPVEQLNAVTHWVDGSMIYGSTEEEEERVVDSSTGFMRTSANNLPPTNRSIDCDARGGRQSACFVAGDSRINEQPALTVTHTLWIREHNRIAGQLRRLHPRWNPTELFEETRRIVIAEVQHINYNEWLPIIIGPALMRQLNINALQSGFRRSYNPSVDPRMSNEFATAVFRFGHSLVQGMYRLVSPTGRQSTYRLRDSFNAPSILQKNPNLMDNFVNSLTIQNIQRLDNQISQELSNHLFETPASGFGMDLMSLNVQRGRDHAISTYNQMRQTFGPGRAQSFVDLFSSTTPDLIRRLQAAYRNVDDIDLFIGGMTESPLQGALLGPTFATIIGKQFQDAVNGDRYFYDMQGQPGSFTPDQLQEVRKSSLAKIYCDNSNVGEMQSLAFRSVSRNNPRVACNSIPSINLQVF